MNASLLQQLKIKFDMKDPAIHKEMAYPHKIPAYTSKKDLIDVKFKSQTHWSHIDCYDSKGLGAK